ncbi:FtsX-like permease family protein [Saccharothrix sp. Mg75]|uniref:FtsX-like permease family protein n=1 Tax=Saccharothrix sp. Mg75 TaxID=3445357 RepID=UPI003EECEBB2
MTAVWRVAGAAVRRRKLQTTVIAVVTGVSTATIVVALGLLTSASAPFDRAHTQQNGAHLVAAYDATAAPDDQLTAAASSPLVTAVAGPFDQVTLDTAGSRIAPALTTAGRADPGGDVDRLDVWQGRWVDGPGEIVLARNPGELGPTRLGDRVDVPGRPALTIVGFAHSVSTSADAWVTPDQMAALDPTDTQLLYRFTAAATADDIAAGQAAVTAGLPPDALLGTRSYLTTKQQVIAESGVYIPFLVVFGILGVVVAVLIVANVISGAVVAGYRHIGVLKSLGFTPDQVMAVYLVLVTVPAAAGCVAGTLLGNLAARQMLEDAFAGFGATDIGIDPWVNAVALLGMPAVVLLAASVSALRARRLPAARAISAGSAPGGGRALAIQRRLAGTHLPRAVSLGLGVPFARPARSTLTLAAVVLGVVTVTLALGITMSVTAYRDAVAPSHHDRVELLTNRPPPTAPPTATPPTATPGAATPPPPIPPRPNRTPHTPTTEPELSDPEDEALLRSLPGATAVAALTHRAVGVAGGGQLAGVTFYRGDATALSPQVLSGHWPNGPGQLAVPSRFLNQRGLAIGDTVTLELEGNRAQVRIVGVVLANNASETFSNWDTLRLLAPDAPADTYQVRLAPGTDQQAYLDAAEAGDAGLLPAPPRDNTSSQAVVIISTATLLTLVLGAVAALGVFNTVVLNARERRRDLGMLKSIGMTPRQVTTMLVTSMAALGVLGGLIGLPLGVAAHSLVAPAMMRAAQADVLDVVVDVYQPAVLVGPVLAGVLITVLGALFPARAAARTTIAEVLRNE